MAATAIGASHLVLAPTAGAVFGYTLLWVVPFSHVFKYPAFEFGPRYAVATGTSLLAGYARVPGPRGWALGVFLLGTVVQGVTVLAGVLGVAAAVASNALPGIPLEAWSAILGLGIVGLLRAGGFDALSGLSKWMLLLLAALTVGAFLAQPPGAGFWRGSLVATAPASSMVLLAALLGWMPTGIDVSVWHSMWALERRDEWRTRASASDGLGLDPADPDPTDPDPTDPDSTDPGPTGVDLAELDRSGPIAYRSFRIARLDMQLGYGLSLLLGMMFVALGAEVLRPRGLVPRGADVAVTLAHLYTEVLGGWVLPVFLLAAFFGMFSTAYGVLDGFPRAFAETVTRLRRARHPSPSGTGEPPAKALYWGFLWTSLVLALFETRLTPDPVLLVSIAAVASFLLAPVTYALNHYCVTRLIDDPALRPGRALRVWSWTGIALMAGATSLFLYVQYTR